MSLMNCPECGYQVSDTARICPNCGSNIANAENFVKVVRPLSSPKRKNYGKMIAEIVGSVILIAIGIPLIGSGIGVVLIVLGIIAFLVAFLSGKKTQQGLCPYCSTMLEFNVDSTKGEPREPPLTAFRKRSVRVDHPNLICKSSLFRRAFVFISNFVIFYRIPYFFTAI